MSRTMTKAAIQDQQLAPNQYIQAQPHPSNYYGLKSVLAEHENTL